MSLPVASRFGSIVLVIALGLGLCAGAVFLQMRPITMPAPAEIRIAGSAVDQSPVSSVEADLQAYSETIERPLFSPTRRALENGQEARSAAQSVATLVLEGTSSNDGERWRAFIGSMSNGATKSYGVDERVAGWTIDKISATEVVLRRGGETARLVLTFGDGLLRTKP